MFGGRGMGAHAHSHTTTALDESWGLGMIDSHCTSGLRCQSVGQNSNSNGSYSKPYQWHTGCMTCLISHSQKMDQVRRVVQAPKPGPILPSEYMCEEMRRGRERGEEKGLWGKYSAHLYRNVMGKRARRLRTLAALARGPELSVTPSRSLDTLWGHADMRNTHTKHKDVCVQAWWPAFYPPKPCTSEGKNRLHRYVLWPPYRHCGTCALPSTVTSHLK